MSVDLDKLNWLSYDPRNAAELAYSGGSLFVRFKGGQVYEYSGVDDRTWLSLQRSVGDGKEFVRLVRDRFVGARVS